MLFVKTGKDKKDIGREAFLERAWRAKSMAAGLKQRRKPEISCDWRRERFTMDEG